METAKDVEVTTAKAVFDGINRNNSISGNNKDRPGKPVQWLSLSSTYGTEVESDDKTPLEVQEKEKEAVAGATTEQAELVEELTEHEKKAKILLTHITKWMGESISENADKSIKSTLKETFLSFNTLSTEALRVPQKHRNSKLDLHWVFGIESYIRTLSWSSQKALTSKIMKQFVNWHKQLFHFIEKKKEDDVEFNQVLCHWEISKGVVAITKWNLYANFPKFTTLGSDAFHEDGKTPVIYCSDETIGQQVATQIGLSHKFVEVVNTEDAKWVTTLEQDIISRKETRIPIVLILNIDAQNLQQGCRLAEAYNIWVHLYGPNVIPYLICRSENLPLGSSITIDMNKWINTPVLPYITLYKSPEKSDPGLMELCELKSANNDLMIFSPWFILNVVGHDEIRSTVNESVRLGKFLYDMVQTYECLKIVVRDSFKYNIDKPSWSELSDGSKIFTSITFQYNPPGFIRNVDENSEDETKAIRPANAAYVDTLNSWLFHIMDRDLKDFVPVEFFGTDSAGWNIFIDVTRCPLREPEDEGVVTSLFDHHLSVLQSTVAQKLIFSQLVAESEELVWVQHESQWAGLGAVRYIPAFHRHQAPEGTKENDEKDSKSNNNSKSPMKENIDHLNAQIVDKLKAIDTAFSLGECATGEWCVQFGMVTMETDVQELVRLVISTGQEIEESSEFLNRMSELVKKGIEKATEELRRESEEALSSEGLLRLVPVVGTFVNWLSPPSKETGIRGRALNLVQGKVESTENIYKYHMQIEASSPTSHGVGNSNNN